MIVSYKGMHAVNLNHIAAFRKEFLIGPSNGWAIMFFFQGGNVVWPFETEDERDKAYETVLEAAKAVRV
jgi:hypothetical protein